MKALLLCLVILSVSGPHLTTENEKDKHFGYHIFPNFPWRCSQDTSAVQKDWDNWKCIPKDFFNKTEYPNYKSLIFSKNGDTLWEDLKGDAVWLCENDTTALIPEGHYFFVIAPIDKTIDKSVYKGVINVLQRSTPIQTE